jgi:dienelactone hydrolase
MRYICLALLVASAFQASADTLPDLMRLNDGSTVATAQDWAKRRAEMTELLLTIEYGHLPPAPGNFRVEGAVSTPAFDGAATETTAVLALGPGHKECIHVGLFVPRGKPGPFPVVLAIEPVWIDSLLPVARKMVERGYIFAGYEKLDLDQDDADRSDGAHPLYPRYDWATLAAWAWGAMRTTDYLLTLDSVDPAKIAITGHSRAGKTALLAGALDERFALVVPHAAGAGGTGSYRVPGPSCETLELITDPKRFHYWFHPRLREYAGRESELPFDQHFLMALVSPRALLSVQGLDDKWANPSGMQLMWLAAQPAFDLLGAGPNNAAFFRPGGHDTTDEDWGVLLEYADHVFFGKPLTHDFYARPFPDVKP